MSEFENMPLHEAAEDPDAATPAAPVEEEKEETVTVEYILHQMELIRADNAHILEAIEKLSSMDTAQSGIAKNIRDVAVSREETNRELIGFYEELYRDIRPSSAAAEFGARVAKEARDAADAATEAAKKAGQTVKVHAKNWTGRLKDLFEEIASDAVWAPITSTEETEKQGKSPLRDRIMEALRDPALEDEDRRLIMDSLPLLKKLDRDMQDKALELLTDVALDCSARSEILEHLEELGDLDD